MPFPKKLSKEDISPYLESVGIKINEKQLYEVNSKDVHVKAIRSMLDDYNNSSNRQNVSLAKGVKDSLNYYDTGYLKSKFFLLDMQEGVFGGKKANIIFIDKPDKIFFVWLTQDEIRGFGRLETEPALMREIQNFIKKFDTRYGL